MSSTFAWTASTNCLPSPGRRPSYQSAAALSSTSAAGWKRNVLATTEALLKSCEDILTRKRSHPSSIEIRNAILDLDFPLFAKILTVQAHGKGFDELFPLGIAQLQSCLKNLGGMRHREVFERAE